MNLAIGTAQFGLDYGISNSAGKVKLPEIKKIIKLATDSGIDTIDTAMAYGDSEELLGKCNLENFKIITKIGAIQESENRIENWILDEVHLSLEKLKLNNIYGLLLHRPNELISKKGETLFYSIQNLKKLGLVKKIGISIYSTDELVSILDSYDIDIVQLPLNIFNREAINNDILKVLKSRNIEIHARSCFLQGLLLMEQKNIPIKFKKWSNLFIDWHEWLIKNDISPVQGCLSFLNSINEIDKVIVGVENVKQLQELINYSSVQGITEFPNLICNDQQLIDPSNWKDL